MNPRILLTLPLWLLAACSFTPTAARKIHVPTAGAIPLPQTALEATVTVDSLSRTAALSLESIHLSRFDKPVESTRETFLCRNGGSVPLLGITLRIDYTLADGTPLHSRTVKIDCDIPAGETRQLSVKSFDVQQSYRYSGSRIPPRRQATPFNVTLTPLRLVFAAGPSTD